MIKKMTKDPLVGLSRKERATMVALLHMAPEQHKDSARPATVKAEGQRRRRERERQSTTEASGDA